jgi:hypothetical protein
MKGACDIWLTAWISFFLQEGRACNENHVDAVLKLLGTASQLAALVVGVLWFLWARRERREAMPLIEFQGDVVERALVGSQRLCEVLFTMKNVGKVRHVVHNLGFRLRALEPGQVALASDENKLLGQTLFPRRLWPGEGFQQVLPADREGWHTVFVEPGVTQLFSYALHVPKDATVLLLNARFFYVRDGRVDHYFQTVVNLQKSAASQA